MRRSVFGKRTAGQREVSDARGQGFGSQRLRSWAFAGIVIWAIVGGGILVLGVGRFVAVVWPALTSFFIAGLLLSIFRPVTRWLRARGLNDAIAALGGVLAALLAAAIIGAIVLGPVLIAAAGFFTSLPAAVAHANAAVHSGVASYGQLPDGVRHAVESASSSLASRLSDIASAGIRALSGLAAGLFELGLTMFLAFILLFWFLKDGRRMAEATLRVIPERLREDARVMASAFDTSFSGYLLATAINTALIFILDGIGFAVIGLPNGWFIAAAGALLGIIPYLGSILSFAVAVFVGFLAGPQIGILTGLIIFVTDQVVYSFIGPVVASKTVILHPVMIMFSVLIGAALGGISGAVLAIPVAAAIRVIYIHYRDRHERSGARSAQDASAAEEA